LNELAQPEFAGVKAYVNKFFPTLLGVNSPSPDLMVKASIRNTRFSHSFQEQQITEAMFKKIAERVEAFFAKLNKKSVDLEIESVPDGATFVLTAQGGSRRTNDTNARITNVFRGIYTFQLSKDGYQSVSREVNLVDEAANNIVCKIYASQAGSCVLK
jgi:hypothetical protein